MLLGVTIGDPAGVGPEVALRVAAMPEVRSLCRLVLVGDMCVLERAHGVVRCGLGLSVVRESALGGVAGDVGMIEVVDCGVLSVAPPFGLPSEQGGRASYTYIQRAIVLAKLGLLGGVVTAPINKLAWSLAGVGRTGHTEVFGEETGSDPYAMMMYSERMAVGLVTCHQSLASVPEAMTTERVVGVGRLLSDSVEAIRGSRPRVAVLGLNPHAGEAGLFGSEEARVIGPAVKLLRDAGVDADGPISPDTAFTRQGLEKWGAHLCMYHDQGLIPFKMLCFDSGVNVTMGLPFVRTSVDHGTAYDIAGRGIADVGSMVEAVRLAAMMVRARGGPRRG